MTPIPSSLEQQRRFTGLDLFHAPEDLGENMVQQADNLYVDGGVFTTRPGLQGMFRTALGAPLHAPLAFVKADGSREILFVSGGNLYRTVKSSDVYTKIQVNDATDFTLAGQGAQMARVGKYVYLIDGGTTTPLYRVNLDQTPAATVATTPLAPTAPVSVSLTNTMIEDFATATGWSARPSPSSTADLVTNGGFELPGGADPIVPSSWTSLGVADPDARTVGSVGGNMTPYAGSYALLLDDPGEGLFQDIVAPTYPSGPVGTARVYAFEGQFHQADHTGGSTVVVTLYGLDAGGNLLGRTSQELTFPYNPDTSVTGWVRAQVTFSLTSLPSDPVKVRLELRGGDKNRRGLQTVFTDAVSLKAVNDSLSITQSSNSFTLSATDVYQGGDYIKKTYGAPKDFSGSNVVALAYASPSTSARPSLRLLFHKSGDAAATRYPSNLMTFSPDGTYASVDITTIPLSVRQSADALYIQIAGDIPGATANNLFTIGPLSAAGNLAISDGVSVSAGPYQYVFTEVAASAAGDIESDPSPVSNAVAATGLKAIASMTLPAPVNTGTGGSTIAATHYQIYRYGGLYGDAVARLIARVPVSSGDIPAYDASHSYTWASANRAFTDDTADGALLLAATLITGRGAPPMGARALCEWQGRLWLATGSTLWGSWLITGDTPGALYYNAVSYPDDPSASIKGFRVSVGGLDNDPIQQLIPLSTALIILKQRSVWMLTGFDSSDFQLSGHYLKAGVGCVAPRAAVLVEGRLWFLGANGVYEFDGGDEINPRSVQIERALNPAQSGGAPIAAAAYAASAMVYHGRRLYLFAPRPGDSSNLAAYVWDSRQDGWTRYLWPPPVGITGAASLSTGADTDDLFLAGTDGQLYQLTGQGDKSLSNSSAVPVAFTFVSRGFGREAGGDAYWSVNRPLRMFASVLTGESVTLTLGARCSGSAATMTQSYTVNGAASLRVKIPSGVRGYVTTVSIGGASVTPARITSVAVESAEGGYHG